MLVGMTLAGCVDDDATATVNEPAELEPEVDGNMTALESFILMEDVAGTFQENATVWVNFTSDLPDEAAANATWSYEISAVNATDVLLASNGTGLPVALNVSLPAGNLSMAFTAKAPGHALQILNVTLDIAGLAVDPCAGAVAQETVEASGSTLAPGDVAAHEFEVSPCQTKIYVAIDIVAGGDFDYYLYDAAGTQVASAASFGAQGVADEGDLSYSKADGLPAGMWRVDIENFASGPADHSLTISFEM
jgi:hypothetical protein